MDNVKQEVVRQAKLVNEIVEGKVFFTGLYGSQNYGLAIETSDVDTHTVVLPNFYDLCFNEQVSKQLGDNAHYKDLRSMVKMWEKQSINFLEPLFSDYQYFVPLYKSEWAELMKMRESVARLNPSAFLTATYGTVHNNLKTAINTKNAKKLARSWYFMEMAQKYKSEYSFSQVLEATEFEKEVYIRMRNYNEEEVTRAAVCLLEEADKRQNEIQSQKFVVNTKMLKELHDWEYALLRKGAPNIPDVFAAWFAHLK